MAEQLGAGPLPPKSIPQQKNITNSVDAEPADTSKNIRGALSGLGRWRKATRAALDRAAAGPLPEKPNEDQVLREKLAQIGVVAFIGSSGTGKSTRALMVARKYGIAYLIDDGLLINGSRIIAGSSAKKAASKLESVRQALFADETRAAVMRRALAENQPATLMILGTSDGMLEKICNNLWLNQPSMLIRIEDVSSEQEMREAKETRLTQGRHTIPVPSMEIKHEFSGHFADPIWRLWRRRDHSVPSQLTESERTVVRPTFSSLGSYSISDEALRDMVEIILRRVKGVAGLVDFMIVKEVYGVVIEMGLALYYGFKAPTVLAEAQRRVASQIEESTSITVMAVNVKAMRVVHNTAE